MRRFVGLIAVLSLIIEPGAIAVAQEEEPALGTEVTLIGHDGGAVGLLTVSGVTEPFEDYEPSSPPQRGSRFVLLELTAENVSPRLWRFDPSRIYLQDGDGFIYAPGGVYRPAEATEATPDLTYQDLAPETETSGAIGYSVLAGVEIIRVLYAPAIDRTLILADLREDPAASPDPSLGETVAYIGPEGGEAGTVTIEEMADPFEDYDSTYPPLRGYHFVLLTVTFENTSPRPFQFDPRSIYFQDTEGFVYGAITVYRPAPAEGTEAVPDLAYQEVAAGASASGVIGFAVLNDAELAHLFFSPASDRVIVLADLRAGEAPDADEGAAGVDEDEATEEAETTPEAEATEEA